jgi:alkaline phosphatase
MKRIALCAVLVVFVGVGVARAAGSSFTARSLRGRYTGSAIITENVPQGGSTNADLNVNEIVIIIFDGMGSFSGTATVVVRAPSSNSPQIVCAYTQTGTYTVEPDGSAEMSFTLTPSAAGGCVSATGTMSGVISQSGRRVDTIITGVVTTPTNFVNSIAGSGFLLKP